MIHWRYLGNEQKMNTKSRNIPLSDIPDSNYLFDMRKGKDWQKRLTRLREIIKLVYPNKDKYPAYTFSDFYYCRNGRYFATAHGYITRGEPCEIISVFDVCLDNNQLVEEAKQNTVNEVFMEKLTLIYDPKSNASLTIGDEHVLNFVCTKQGTYTVGNDIFIIAARVAIKNGLRQKYNIKLIIDGKEAKVDMHGELSHYPETDTYTKLLTELI